MDRQVDRPHYTAYWYKLNDIHFIEQQTMRFGQSPFEYGLLFTETGEGTVMINGKKEKLQQHRVKLIPPHSTVQLPNHSCYVRFCALLETDGNQLSPAKLPDIEDFEVSRNWQELNLKFKKMRQLASSEAEWDQYELRQCFHEWLRLLFPHKNTSDRKRRDDVMEEIRSYMESHHILPLTRDDLAKMAGMHVDYFSRSFKQRFGTSPQTYLNDVRLRKAKELLLDSSHSVREVAAKVGFRDEFYFSRKFKAKEGRPPAVFLKEMKRSARVVSLNHLVTGNLLALGVNPYGAIKNHAFPVSNELKTTITVGKEGLNLDKLMDIQPEIILLRQSAKDTLSKKEQLVSQIAPTVSLSFYDDWRTHLKTIANVIGQEEKAARWLERYDETTFSLQKKVKQRMGHASFLVIGIGEERLCIYGKRNIGSVLYDDLGMDIPVEISNVRHLQEIECKDLSSFQADYVLLTVYRKNDRTPSPSMIQKQLRILFRSKQWQILNAVRKGRVMPIYGEQHLYTSYNPYSHMRLVNLLQDQWQLS